MEAGSPQDVTELVDEVEGALESVSKGDKGAFDRLVNFLGLLLPLVLVMADELKTLKVSMDRSMLFFCSFKMCSKCRRVIFPTHLGKKSNNTDTMINKCN